MPLLKRNEDNQLERLQKTTIKNEREIQTLTEQCLNDLFRLLFLKTQFNLNYLCIDTPDWGQTKIPSYLLETDSIKKAKWVEIEAFPSLED